eukprot:TRINITY_DN4366_c0_g1_i1.p1 TRINITY_DN4366_c0_g1~~TRINITY_DN4366_c0_g1_i1.p1  ORF type:complete len:142 (-),score=48.87 TRINITY_DN4366_c0_g1_i1:175-600(-)
MNEIFEFDRKKEKDYYEILGCGPSNNKEQITTEFHVRALRSHPDRPDGDVQQFQLLQEAFNVLGNDEKRKSYDQWRNSSVAISFERWCLLQDEKKNSFHWRISNSTPQIEPQSQSQVKLVVGESSEDGPDSAIWKFRNYQI